MNVNKLESFLATVDHGTVSAAAAQLGIGQPAVSKHLNALEAELGVELFDSESRRTALSPAGAKVLSTARVIVQAVIMLRAELETGRNS
ncbi:LysR family transcriptional regulator [Pseudomonas sp. NPDC089401]|uniref:LysR family transcriptional regulator n=1 Tax=Pseudomonas sp. NPDC089401 TaxID=3364462 RepID=UPI0037F7DAA5